MKTSRQRLLDYIQAHRAVTILEISRALRMTPANARHHLSILGEQGLVQIAGHRPGSGKGRPAAVYRLSQPAQGAGLHALSSALLVMMTSDLPENALPRLAQRLAGEGEGHDGPGSGSRLSQRLVRAVQRLNELGYQARWEAHATAPRLILGCCPYAAILPEHPELCQVDAALLETLAGASAGQTARLAPDRQGLPHCIFVIGKRGTSG